jgi:8-oxo-dGTP pyrophosphatase MutT (NUDIX family)
MTVLRWQIVGGADGADYRVFRTMFVDGLHPVTGAMKRFSVIECVDWVNVIALTPRDEVVLIRQYRAGTASICLEIPGGMVDAGEPPLAAAQRELAEETGYVAAHWGSLGRVAPNPAIQRNHLHCFLALDAEPSGAQHFDTSEVIAVELAPLAEVRAMIVDGRIDHALVINAFAQLALRGGAVLERPRRL